MNRSLGVAGTMTVRNRSFLQVVRAGQKDRSTDRRVLIVCALRREAAIPAVVREAEGVMTD